MMDLTVAALFISIVGLGALCGLLVYEMHMEEDVLMATLTLVAIMTS